MKNKKYKISMLLIGTLSVMLLALCTTTSQSGSLQTAAPSRGGNGPAWATDINSVYPEKDYLAVVGEGDTRRDAESDAAGALSKIFISEIKLESTATMRFQQLETAGSSTSTTERSVDKTVAVGSSQTLFNIQYSDPWTDGTGKVHIAGFLNRRDTAKIYKDKIDKNADRVVLFLKNMRESSSIISQYAFIDAAVLYAKTNNQLLDQLIIIYQPMVQLIDLPYKTDDLIKLYSEIAAKMSFQIQIKNDSEDRLAKITTHILNERGFTIARGPASLSIRGEVSMEDAQLENRFANIRWYLTLEMRDERGSVLVSFNKNQRESGI
ncbi:MAG: hypothetical protein EHM28_11210, partial [Spirochaetaceae bacterium]